MALVRDTSVEGVNIENVPIVREFMDIFPEELPGLPPRMEIVFHIDIVPGAKPHINAALQNGPNRIEGTEGAITRAYRQGFYPSKYLPLGRSYSICEKERWVLKVMY